MLIQILTNHIQLSKLHYNIVKSHTHHPGFDANEQESKSKHVDIRALGLATSSLFWFYTCVQGHSLTKQFCPMMQSTASQGTNQHEQTSVTTQHWHS